MHLICICFLTIQHTASTWHLDGYILHLLCHVVSFVFMHSLCFWWEQSYSMLLQPWHWRMLESLVASQEQNWGLVMNFSGLISLNYCYPWSISFSSRLAIVGLLLVQLFLNKYCCFPSNFWCMLIFGFCFCRMHLNWLRSFGSGYFLIHVKM